VLDEWGRLNANDNNGTLLCRVVKQALSWQPAVGLTWHSVVIRSGLKKVLVTCGRAEPLE
jgi:hypothetical protein